MIQEMVLSFLEMQLKNANIGPEQVQALFMRAKGIVDRLETMEKNLIEVKQLLSQKEATKNDHDSDNGRKQLGVVNG